MTPSFNTCSTKQVTTSGTGVIGATGKGLNLQGIYNTQASSQGLALYSGSAAVTMAMITLPARLFTPFPMAAPGGITYQTIGNPGDAALGLVFFWIPDPTT